MNFAAVVVDLHKLRRLPEDPIPSPSAVRSLEQCHTLSAVLPGRNVVGKTADTDTPRKFFRHVVHRELSGATLARGHETLLGTLRAITSDRSPQTIRCPSDDCDQDVLPGVTSECDCGEIIYLSDSLRTHERFEDTGSSEQAFTAVRMVVEHLSMLNVARWLEEHSLLSAFDTTGFIMDGPLAIFGMPAWLKRHIQTEIGRLHLASLKQGGAGLFLIGVEKTGMFVDHLEALDWSDPEGSRSRIPLATALAADKEYIHRHVALRPPDAKAHGAETHYGRNVMYKTRSGQHSVLWTPIVNDRGKDPYCIDEEVYSRIGEALDLLDELGTYLYRDGFAPLVRAHAHAAIPLRTGTEILASLFNPVQ